MNENPDIIVTNNDDNVVSIQFQEENKIDENSYINAPIQEVIEPDEIIEPESAEEIDPESIVADATPLDQLERSELKKIVVQGLKENSFMHLDLNAKSKEILTEVIIAYIYNKDIKVLDRLPKSLRAPINEYFNSASKVEVMDETPESAAKDLIDNIVTSIDTMYQIKYLQNAMNDEYVKLERGYMDAADEAYDDAFKNIDKIREENPEQAEKIESVKTAFEKARTFDALLEFLHTEKPRDARKYAYKYAYESGNFNTILSNNKFALKFPKIESVYELLKVWFTKTTNFDKDNIKEFIVLICRSTTGSLDMDQLENVAYTHRLIHNIYKFSYRNVATDDTYDDMILSIIDVMNAIQAYKNSNKGG